MKKLLGILVLGLLLIVFFVVNFASQTHAADDSLDYLEHYWDRINLSCSGNMSVNYGTISKNESFWQDIQLLYDKKSKKLKLFGIIGTSHLYLRTDAPKVKNADKSSIRAEAGYDTYDDGDERIIQKENLSLISGRYQGHVQFVSHGYSGVANFNAKCSGIDELVAYLNDENKKNNIENFPDIDDDEIISASSGSGFFVSKEGHIITNFHVIENCDSIKINFKGKEVVSEIFAIDKINDLAIVQANIKPLKIFSVSNKDVTLLQDVIVAGYPLGKYLSSAIKMHKGSVTALTGYEDNYSNFQTDATINQGNSGGPIIDKKGNVVGIAVATWVEEGVQGIHFGIKSSVLRTFANAKELNFLPPNRREIPKEKLGELISEATTYLECWMTGAKIKKMIAEANNKKAFYSKFKQ